MITVIAGYPGSGKTTLARKLAGENGGVVLDLDALTAALAGTAPHAKAASARTLALAVNEAFWPLAEALDRRGLAVYAIRTAPGPAEWEAHVRYCARILLHRDKAACLAEVSQREGFDREGFEAACAAVERMRAGQSGRWQVIAWEERQSVQ